MISRPAVIPSLYMIHLWSLTLAARTTAAAAAETLLLPDLLSIIYNWIKTAQSQSRKPTIAPSSELWRTTLTLLLQKRNNNVNARHHTNTSPAESQKITPPYLLVYDNLPPLKNKLQLLLPPHIHTDEIQPHHCWFVLSIYTTYICRHTGAWYNSQCIIRDEVEWLILQRLLARCLKK